MKFLLSFTLAFLSAVISLSAQLTGLWEVQSVVVGKEQLTPVAKWFKLEADKSVTGGNGGVRNTIGTYQYDANANTLLYFNENGKADEMGSFQIKISGNGMEWHRKEEGMEVTIGLQRVEEIPLAPWDKIVGLWKWQEGDDWHHLQIRWDREYRLRTPQSINDTQLLTLESGIWHINGHHPHLRLISNKGDEFDSEWTIQFEGNDQMILTADTEGDTTVRQYKRINN